MKRANKKKRKISIQDLIIVICSILALIGVICIIIYSKKTERQKQENLNNVSSQLEKQEIQKSQTEESFEGLVINEVNADGWMELYNTETKAVKLSGCSVYIDGTKTIDIDDVEIAASEYKIVELGSTIKSKKETIVTILDGKDGGSLSLMLPELNVGESYGCTTDAGIEKSVMSATKEATNKDSVKAAVEQLTFSVPGGFYDDAFELTMEAPAGCEIYYTTDGTAPSKKATKYQSALSIGNRSGADYKYAATEGTGLAETSMPSSINQGVVVRAITVDAAGKESDEYTQSYYVGLKNATGYVNMPVISITTNPENLFDYDKGMYVLGRSYEDAVAQDIDLVNRGNMYNGWTKDATIEYFEADKSKTYEGSVKLSMLTDYSVLSPQKGFHVTASDGAFVGSSLETFLNDENKAFDIQTNKMDNGYKIREYFVNSMIKETSVGAKAISPCVVFIDGEYWGGYMLSKAFDQKYLKSTYNVDEKAVFVRDAIASDPHYQKEYNSFRSFVMKSDMTKESNYTKVRKQMDIQSFLDYLCVNMFIANGQYGSERSVTWKTVKTGDSEYADGKWRFLIGNTDYSLDNEILGELASSSIDSFLMPGVIDDDFTLSLLKNKEFKKQLIETMDKMVDEIFTKEKTETTLNQVVNKVQKFAINSYTRFFGKTTDDFYSSEIEKITEFLDERGDYIKKYTEEIAQDTGKMVEMYKKNTQESTPKSNDKK